MLNLCVIIKCHKLKDIWENIFVTWLTDKYINVFRSIRKKPKIIKMGEGI